MTGQKQTGKNPGNPVIDDDAYVDSITSLLIKGLEWQQGHPFDNVCHIMRITMSEARKAASTIERSKQFENETHVICNAIALFGVGLATLVRTRQRCNSAMATGNEKLDHVLAKEQIRNELIEFARLFKQGDK